MTLHRDGPAPYTTPSAVVGVLDRMRKGTLPKPPIDTATLTMMGVQESLAPRTIASLKLLDLIDEAGNPTKTLTDVGHATSDEYPKLIETWLRTLYAEVFQVIGDPATAEYKQVEDAFRRFNPAGQRKRMVTLFIGLSEYAGLLPEGSALLSATRIAGAPRQRQPRTAKPKPVVVKASEGGEGGGSTAQVPIRDPAAAPDKNAFIAQLKHETGQAPHPMIAGLFQTLPPAGSVWPQVKRDAWVGAAAAVFGVLYELPSDTPEEVSAT
jgi:hypothetical protein